MTNEGVQKGFVSAGAKVYITSRSAEACDKVRSSSNAAEKKKKLAKTRTGCQSAYRPRAGSVFCYSGRLAKAGRSETSC